MPFVGRAERLFCQNGGEKKKAAEKLSQRANGGGGGGEGTGPSATVWLLSNQPQPPVALVTVREGALAPDYL